MSRFYEQLTYRIIEDGRYKEASELLFHSYVAKLAGERYEIERGVVKKLSTTVQYLLRSGVEELEKEAFILLSMLLDVAGDEYPELVNIAENLYFQSGDFPNIQLLKNRFEFHELKISIFDEFQKDLRININTVEELGQPLTDYQRTLWEDLTSDKDIVTSAPTSSGKTHVILRYLLLRLLESEGAFAAIVVPTRALISELSRKIYDLAKKESAESDIEICTVPKKGPFKDKTFFVMTQERLFETLQSGDLYFNYLFIDEAHNISDVNRGVLLHLTLQKLLDGSNPQIITSMPSQRYQNAFDSVFAGVDLLKRATKHSPVAKLIMSVVPKGRHLEISRYGNDKSVSISKEFKGTSLADIVYRLGQGESNIIYRNRTDSCENTASAIAALISEDKDSESLEEAADYVESFLHENFSLAGNLRKGVAFHYGPLPGAMRTAIEDLARDGEIEFIVCTSTLAEGVNLPAKNLFLDDPKQPIPYQPSEKLEDVTLGNITGRAGRMLEHFSGNVFLINHDDWKFKDYFVEAEEEPNKIPTYFKLINEEFDGVINALEGRYDFEDSRQYSFYTIANKLLKEFSSENLHSTFEAKELAISRPQKEALLGKIEEAFLGLKIDSFTLEANPSIGYIQQNNLYEILLTESDLENWVLPHPRSSSLFDRLDAICTLLHRTGIFLPNESIRHVCTIATKWIRGEPLKSIIAGQISYDAEHGNASNCNKSVRDVIKIINNDIRFKMSSALRCYHSIITDVIAAKQEELQSIKLYSYIEVGADDERVISLINMGLSRESALELNAVLPSGMEVNSISTLKRSYARLPSKSLHGITNKEIRRLID